MTKLKFILMGIADLAILFVFIIGIGQFGNWLGATSVLLWLIYLPVCLILGYRLGDLYFNCNSTSK